MTAWREEKEPVDRVERLTVEELHDRWEADRDAIQVLDVRERDEWERGHIPASLHMPYHDIRGLPDEIDAGRPWPRSAAPGSGPRWRRACSSASARTT